MTKKTFNENDITYVEPEEYFPKEIWEKIEKQIKENESKEKDKNES
ncbi:MAG: hypothetical protein IJI67_06245 [Clostridia bacterium]|nr:hypothetical protein [Clostridia bacterium]